MDNLECSWCGVPLEEKGVPFKGLLFCSLECKEEWEQDLADSEDFDLDEIAGDEFDEDDEVLTDFDDDL